VGYKLSARNRLRAKVVEVKIGRRDLSGEDAARLDQFDDVGHHERCCGGPCLEGRGRGGGDRKVHGRARRETPAAPAIGRAGGACRSTSYITSSSRCTSKMSRKGRRSGAKRSRPLGNTFSRRRVGGRRLLHLHPVGHGRRQPARRPAGLPPGAHYRVHGVALTRELGEHQGGDRLAVERAAAARADRVKMK